MKIRSTLLLAVGATLALSACDNAKTRSANEAATPIPANGIAPAAGLITAPTGPVTERPGSITWNQQALNFEYGGKPMTTGRQWVFTSAPSEFMVAAAASGPADGSGLAVTENRADVVLRSAGGLNLDGGKYPLMIVRLTRIKAGDLWDGSVHYTTIKHPESEAYLAKAPKDANPGVNETVTIVYDMHKLRRGGDDWKTSKIDQIRIDLDDAPGGAFIIHQIAVAERPAGYQ
jgi:hypothetical protein